MTVIFLLIIDFIYREWKIAGELYSIWEHKKKIHSQD